MTEDHTARTSRVGWVRENAGQIAMMSVILLSVVAVGGAVFFGVADDMKHYVETDYDGQFEDACNEEFGYEWEYSRWVSQPDDGGAGEWEIECHLDMGFLSGTDETITVVVE